MIKEICGAAVSLTFVLGLLGVASHAVAADSELLTKLGCTVPDRSDKVALVLCPSTVTGDALAKVGEAACPGKGVRCNAWVWHDSNAVPKKAPDKDENLPKTQTAKAVAVWVNDSERLISLRKVR